MLAHHEFAGDLLISFIQFGNIARRNACQEFHNGLRANEGRQLGACHVTHGIRQQAAAGKLLPAVNHWRGALLIHQLL